MEAIVGFGRECDWKCRSHFVLVVVLVLVLALFY
jgi:hypothetical protein